MLSRKAIVTYMALGSCSATSAGENLEAFRSTRIRSCKIMGRAAASRSWLRSEMGGQSCLASMLLRGGYGYDRRNYGGGYYYDDDDLDEDFDDDEEDEGGVFSYGNRRATQRQQQGGIFSGLGSTFQGMPFIGGNMQQMRYGFMLVFSGAVVTFFGVMFLFNQHLLRFGNILFISGMPFLVGTGRTISFFMNPSKLRATTTFLVGAFLVVFGGWPRIGLVIEFFGFLNLFGNFFPLLASMLRGLPVVGDVLPGSGGSGGRRSESDRRSNFQREDYYDDDY